MTATQDTPTASVATPTSSLRVFGVSTAGLNITESLLRGGLEGASFVAVNTDAASLAASSAPVKLLLEPKRLRGLDTGGDPERGRAAAEENLARLAELCRGVPVVLIVTGLGGGAGTGISPVLARVAREAGALVLVFAVTPFDCEGNRRQRQALHGLEQLRAAADGVICLSNQKLCKLIDEHTSLRDAFQLANDLLAEGLRGLGRLFARPGLIPVHLTDLCTLLRGRHAESTLATAEARGPTRARDVAEKLLAHPLLDGGQALAEADAVVVSFSGGPDLSLADVNRVMERINRQCENAQVLMGAAVEEAFRERLVITLLATRRMPRTYGSAENEPAPSETPDRATHLADDDDTELLSVNPAARGKSRLVPPAPTLGLAQLEQTLARQAGPGGRPRQPGARLRQGTLPLEVVSRGRFERTEPNIRHGEDLDVPTYLRRGCVLN